MAYQTRLTPLQDKAGAARVALQDFWQEYINEVGGPDKVNRTALQVAQTFNGILATIERGQAEADQRAERRAA